MPLRISLLLGIVLAAVLPSPAGAPLGTAAKQSCSGQAGKLTRVYPKARINGAVKKARAQLRNKDHLTTSPGGEAYFCIKKKGMSCDGEGGSSIVVRPGDGVILNYGPFARVTCDTTKTSNTPGHWCTTTQACFTAADPVFTVVVNRKKSVLKVSQGLMRATGGGATVVVGPKEQVTVPARSAPLEVVPIQLTAHQHQVAQSLEKQVPNRKYAPPSAVNSPTVNRIDQRGTIIVGIDNTYSSMQPWFKETNAFIDHYFAFLAKKWGLTSEFPGVSPKVADRELMDGAIDVFVSPDTVFQSPGQLWSLPLLKDPNGRSWKVYGSSADDAFRRDVRSFLLQSVRRADYGAQYKSAFGRNPSYGIFTPLGG